MQSHDGVRKKFDDDGSILFPSISTNSPNSQNQVKLILVITQS